MEYRIICVVKARGHIARVGTTTDSPTYNNMWTVAEVRQSMNWVTASTRSAPPLDARLTSSRTTRFVRTLMPLRTTTSITCRPATDVIWTSSNLPERPARARWRQTLRQYWLSSWRITSG